MKKILQRIIRTEDTLVLTVVRITLGMVMIPHGAQKLLGLFGGYGFSGTMNYFTGMGMPAAAAFLVIMAESLGSLALILGFIGRFMALGITMVMTGALFMVHLANGFFMNWGGQQQGEGFEFHLLAMGLGIAVMIGGSGRFSLDGLLKKWLA
jgi:putative oxidoreductase